MRLVLGVLFLAVLSRPFAAAGPRSHLAQAPPSAAEMARQIQTHYNTVRDFTADFTHSYRGGALRQTASERGKVRIKKPGRMFWDYTEPDKKQFVADGSKIYSYVVADKVYYVSDIPANGEASAAVLFLAGRGDLVRDFTPALPAAQPDAAWQLDFTPKTRQENFSSLTLTVDRRSFALRGLSFVDDQAGTSTFVFQNLRENVGLSDNQFVFKPPRGVEVRR
jgi:outer membrane lipoprotein carrier protein